MASAYDYTAQAWVRGAEGTTLRLAQIEDELALLRGPKGYEYAQWLTGQTTWRARLQCIVALNVERGDLLRDQAAGL